MTAPVRSVERADECAAGVQPANYNDAIRLFAQHDGHSPYACRAWFDASTYLSGGRDEGAE